jgi:hypothetical protein
LSFGPDLSISPPFQVKEGVQRVCHGTTLVQFQADRPGDRLDIVEDL